MPMRPPLPPGAIEKHVLTFSGLLADDATEFDGAAFAQRLAAVFNMPGAGLVVPASSIQVNIPLPLPAVGLRVAATIDFVPAEDAGAALTLLSRLTTPTLSMRLGVTIVRVEVLRVDLVVRNAPSPPPPASPPLPPTSPSPSPSPPAPSVTVGFLAPRHVEDHVLATVRALQTVFAQAFAVPSSWLEITVAEDSSQSVKPATGQKLFLMAIELAPEHFSTELLVTIQGVISDEDRLADLLTTAVPGAALVSLSLISPAPPPMPVAPAAPLGSAGDPLARPPATPAPLCKLCPSGFKCPAGSRQPVPCEEGTEQPNAGATECVAVPLFPALGGSNATTVVKTGQKDELEGSSNAASDAENFFVAHWIPIVASLAIAVLCCLLACAMCAWHLRQEQWRFMEDSVKNNLVDKRDARVAVLVQEEDGAPAPSDADFRSAAMPMPRFELRKGRPRTKLAGLETGDEKTDGELAEWAAEPVDSAESWPAAASSWVPSMRAELDAEEAERLQDELKASVFPGGRNTSRGSSQGPSPPASSYGESPSNSAVRLRKEARQPIREPSPSVDPRLNPDIKSHPSQSSIDDDDATDAPVTSPSPSEQKKGMSPMKPAPLDRSNSEGALPVGDQEELGSTLPADALAGLGNMASLSRAQSSATGLVAGPGGKLERGNSMERASKKSLLSVSPSASPSASASGLVRSTLESASNVLRRCSPSSVRTAASMTKDAAVSLGASDSQAPLPTTRARSSTDGNTESDSDTASSAPADAPKRPSLFDEIRAGKNLKKTELPPPASDRAAVLSSGGTLDAPSAALMAQLAQGMDSRRRFSNVDGDSDGESSENDSTPSPSNRTEEEKPPATWTVPSWAIDPTPAPSAPTEEAKPPATWTAPNWATQASKAKPSASSEFGTGTWM